MKWSRQYLCSFWEQGGHERTMTTDQEEIHKTRKKNTDAKNLAANNATSWAQKSTTIAFSGFKVMAYLPSPIGITLALGACFCAERLAIPIVFRQIESRVTQSAACPAAIFNHNWVQLSVDLLSSMSSSLVFSSSYPPQWMCVGGVFFWRTSYCGIDSLSARHDM